MSKDDIHYKKVRFEINAADNQAASQGLLGSSAHCAHLCEVLQMLVKEYAENEFNYALHAVKAGKHKVDNIATFCSQIEKEIELAIHNHHQLLNDAILRTLGSHNDQFSRILKELDFVKQSKNDLRVTSNKYQALLSEYFAQKNREEKTLSLAQEANRISRRNTWISVGALIISTLAFLYTFFKG